VNHYFRNTESFRNKTIMKCLIEQFRQPIHSTTLIDSAMSN